MRENLIWKQLETLNFLRSTLVLPLLLNIFSFLAYLIRRTGIIFKTIVNHFVDFIYVIMEIWVLFIWLLIEHTLFPLIIIIEMTLLSLISDASRDLWWSTFRIGSIDSGVINGNIQRTLKLPLAEPPYTLVIYQWWSTAI